MRRNDPPKIGGGVPDKPLPLHNYGIDTANYCCDTVIILHDQIISLNKENFDLANECELLNKKMIKIKEILKPVLNYAAEIYNGVEISAPPSDVIQRLNSIHKMIGD